MSNLKSVIESLSQEFARNVLAALKQASIEEIVGVTGGGVASGRGRASSKKAAGKPARAAKGGRLPRRSIEALNDVVEKIAGVLSKNPEGLRSEQIRDALGLEAREMPRPLAEGLKSGRLRKVGEKRSTLYFLSTGKGGAKGGAKRRRRAK